MSTHRWGAIAASSMFVALGAFTAIDASDQSTRSAEAEARAKQINIEAVAPFVGEYNVGDGFGHRSLEIHANGRFRYEESGCMGVYNRNSGPVEFVDGHLLLKPELPNVHREEGEEDSEWTETDFVPIRWGKRLYLIPDKRRDLFCNAVNQGREPRHRPQGFLYIRGEGWKEPAEGEPDLPESWKPLILKHPIEGKVVEILAEDRGVVDLGAEDGLWKGMDLWPDKARYRPVEVLEVRPKSAVVARDGRCSDPPIKVGQAVRSGWPEILK